MCIRDRDVIYFIESTAEEARAKAGTIQTIGQLTHQKLVALDLNSGQRQWERDHDFSKLQFMTYLVYADDMLIATGTDKDKNYHTYALAASRRPRTALLSALAALQQARAAVLGALAPPEQPRAAFSSQPAAPEQARAAISSSPTKTGSGRVRPHAEAAKRNF